MAPKYTNKPIKQHKSLATGESLSEASAEEKVGGSKSDKSRGTNK
jgi:hypothetical protein